MKEENKAMTTKEFFAFVKQNSGKKISFYCYDKYPNGESVIRLHHSRYFFYDGLMGYEWDRPNVILREYIIGDHVFCYERNEVETEGWSIQKVEDFSEAETVELMKAFKKRGIEKKIKKHEDLMRELNKSSEDIIEIIEKWILMN